MRMMTMDASETLVGLLKKRDPSGELIIRRVSTSKETYRFDFYEDGSDNNADDAVGGHALEGYSRFVAQGVIAEAKMRALPRLIWNACRVLFRAFRPYVLVFGASRIAILIIRWLRRRWSASSAKATPPSWFDTLTFFASAKCFSEHIRDTYHDKDGFGAAPTMKSGMHVHPQKSCRLAKALCGIKRTSFSQAESSWLLGGDMQSIMPGLLGKLSTPSMNIAPMIVTFESDREALAIDWISGGPPCNRVKGTALLLPGVGGGSKETYISCIADSFLRRGYAVAVLHPRGLGPVRVNKPENVFDMADVSDVATTIQIFADIFGEQPITLVGFSMGAIILGNYCSVIGAAIPKSVTSCVAISGAFKLDFMEWNRYKTLYQRIIAPGLILKMLHMYGCSFEEVFQGKEVRDLLDVASYREISEQVLIPLLQKRGVSYVNDFESWKARSETSFEDRKRIDIPFLLLAAANDPLHHSGMIGVPEKDSDMARNVAYLITEQGGHVGWGECGGMSRNFLTSATVGFSLAAAS